MNINHSIITKIFEKGMNNLSRGIVERQQAQKKRPMCLEVQSFFFVTKYSLKRDDVN